MTFVTRRLLTIVSLAGILLASTGCVGFVEFLDELAYVLEELEYEQEQAPRPSSDTSLPGIR